jgi:predicted P-loop ATPase
VPDEEKDLLQNIHSTWFFELAELEHVTSKRSAGKLKNTITTAIDNYRSPYGKAPERKPRSSVFVSSVNGEAFLRDDTGERRYYVIDCPQVYAKGELIDIDAVVRDRDRIWKAAMQAYKAGEKPCLSYDFQKESNLRNEDYQVEHPWAGPLDEWLTPSEHAAKWVERYGDFRKGAPEQFTSAQALIGCGVRDEKCLRKSDEMEIALLLTQRGYVKRRVKVKGRPRQWVWSKAEAVT